MECTDNAVLVDEVIIDSRRANFQAFTLMAPLAVMAFTPYYIIWRNALTLETLREFATNAQAWKNIATLIILAVMASGIVLHELIHATTWAIFAKGGFKTIQFGIIWRELTPYCHCSEPLPTRHYILGMVAPGILLGILPALLSYITGNLWLMLFGVFFTAAAAGDIIILRKLKTGTHDYIRDHPHAIGYQVWRVQNPT